MEGEISCVGMSGLTSGLVLLSRAAASLATSLAGLMGVDLAVGELWEVCVRNGSGRVRVRKAYHRYRHACRGFRPA